MLSGSRSAPNLTAEDSTPALHAFNKASRSLQIIKEQAAPGCIHSSTRSRLLGNGAECGYAPPGLSADVGGQSIESAWSPDGRLFLDILDGGSKGLWRRNRDATLPEYGSNAVGQSHTWERLG